MVIITVYRVGILQILLKMLTPFVKQAKNMGNPDIGIMGDFFFYKSIGQKHKSVKFFNRFSLDENLK